jgi:hypothetical protein
MPTDFFLLAISPKPSDGLSRPQPGPGETSMTSNTIDTAESVETEAPQPTRKRAPRSPNQQENDGP